MDKRSAQSKQSEPVPFDYAAQWSAKAAPEELTLSSGKKVKVQSPNMLALVRGGAVPNHLLPIIERYILNYQQSLKELKSDAGLQPGERIKRIAEHDDFTAAYCVAAVVEPRLSFDGTTPGTIDVHLLNVNERTDVWLWGEGLSAPLTTFPDDGAGPVDAVAAPSDSDSVRDAAQQPAGVD